MNMKKRRATMKDLEAENESLRSKLKIEIEIGNNLAARIRELDNELSEMKDGLAECLSTDDYASLRSKCAELCQRTQYHDDEEDERLDMLMKSFGAIKIDAAKDDL